MEDVIEGRYVSAYTIWLRFEDGTEGEIDLSQELHGAVFELLQKPEYFASFRVNRDTGTIEWPNGADFAPEFLYEKVRVTA
ncbi:MAG TPA: DUF2442 domain-containing protein [Thermoanaerobaculia bacterium]|jgi:hypothetical protein|nr:DUF2442 domain-containing protein [Thermoanaerobaculia bacterium]